MNRVERIKKEKDGLEVWPDILRYAREGFSAIAEDDFERFKWYGIYRQRPKDSGYFMLRIKIPNGDLRSEQLMAIAEIARDYAHGFGDITTRQDIQLHWLTIEQLPDAIARLRSVGLTTTEACGDVMRNVVGCPVAGVSREELLDASPLVKAVTGHFLDNREFSDLPRKYKISISGCMVRCEKPEIMDVGFTAVREARGGPEQIGFRVRVGGGLSTQPHFSKDLGVFITEEEILPVCRAITEIFRDCGYRESRGHARLKFLVADWGVERFREELERRLGRRLCDGAPYREPPDSYRDHIGINEQKQPGLYYVGICILVGRIRWREMKRIAELAREYGDGTIRNTNMQNILILNVPQRHLDRLGRELSQAGLSFDGSRFRRGTVSCTGKEFCNLAVTETKEWAKGLVEWLEREVRFDEPIRINVNGCPNSCAQHHVADIGLQGSLVKVGDAMVESYDLSLGGGLGSDMAFGRVIRRRIPADEVKYAIRELIDFYQQNRADGESFRQFCRRHSTEELAAVINRGLNLIAEQAGKG